MDIPTTRSSVRLDLLHPWMVTRLEAFFADPRVKGNVKVCSGCRSYADQMRFYKKYKAGTGNLAANPDRRFGPKGLDGQGIWRGSWHMQQLDGWCYAVDLRLVGKALTTGDTNQIATEYGLRPTVPSEWWHHQPRKGTEWFPAPALGDDDPVAAGAPVVEGALPKPPPPEPKVDWAGIAAAIHAQRLAITKKPLARGSRGDAVKTVQMCLGNAGFACGVPDGIYGRKTTAAVRKFQKKRAIKVSGTVNVITFDALFS